MNGFPHTDDARAWAGRAVEVPAKWFTQDDSWLHGVRHTQRVHIHALRLVRELHWPERDARVVLRAALWHDIGRGERRAIDEADPERALRVLWLLKDADAFDRVRLGSPGAGRLRDRFDHVAPHVHHQHDRVRGGAARRHAVELPPRSSPK